MKYYKLFAILVLAGIMACSGEKKEQARLPFKNGYS